jgi:hypothetical protein
MYEERSHKRFLSFLKKKLLKHYAHLDGRKKLHSNTPLIAKVAQG